MIKIFKNMVPYWHLILVILALLVVQAFCDLSLPQYTSDIIDVGILNGGISHILPEKITAGQFEETARFMTDEERAAWEASYEKDSEAVYSRNVSDEEKLDALDETLLMPVIFSSYAVNKNAADIPAGMESGPPSRETLEKMTESMGEDAENISVPIWHKNVRNGPSHAGCCCWHWLSCF